jgi:hypothetical protein
MPGTGGYVERETTFWDIGNDFIGAAYTASLISLSDLRDPDYSVEAMSVSKRGVVFM